MPLDRFHPAVAAWFNGAFVQPTPCQRRAWPAIGRGQHTLIAAPTGSGKTLAAFYAAIDELVQLAQRGPLPDATRVLYVSPLKALSNDVQRNLEAPLSGIENALLEQGQRPCGIRALVRTGDTPSSAREAMRRKPPHILVTTPESLYLLLTSEGGRNMLRSVRSVIVDEVHAVVGSKRGAHLSLSLERLEALTAEPPVRIGLSATQKPIQEVARFLVGSSRVEDSGRPDCVIVDEGHNAHRDLAIELPGSPLQAVMSGEVWGEVYDRLAALVREHHTTLVFVNTRRMAERVARHLSERLVGEVVTSHHGSLSKTQRLDAETRLKSGALKALVATASLELGIDIGDVDLVCQLGSTRTIATFLQRVGRSGHNVGGTPKGRLFPTSRDELVECVALLDSVQRGELDCLSVPVAPLDVLAQQIVAMSAAEDWEQPALLDCLRRAWPYRNLDQSTFAQSVRMLAEGFSTRRGRRSAYLHHDAVNRRIKARRGARLTALTSGGAIPDNADYDVILEPTGTFLGTLNEDFAIESLAGDIFQLGNSSWRVLRIESGKVRVEDAKGMPPNMPFWFGEAPGRSDELSASVARLRAELGARIGDGGGTPESRAEVVPWLCTIDGVSEPAATQLIEYLAAARATLTALPDDRHLVLERFFDESGGMQLVIHSSFGSRINRAFGLALRKRFCRKFNFELQAAATEDAIVLSLGETHSFALQEVGRYLNKESVRDVLVQALLDAPMFTVRWRWNANIALAVPRVQGGRKVPPQLQRVQAEDLVAVVFPDQIACAENLAGRREIPDHPLVAQTIDDCLNEAMDIDGLERLLGRLQSGELELVCRDLTEPSPLAQEILNARPYAFLDDAPLEERRTRAVASRRWLDPESAADLGRLDADAIRRVREEAWPRVGNADELHDMLVILGFAGDRELRSASPTASALEALLSELVSARRATRLEIGDGRHLWVAAERLQEARTVHPLGSLNPEIEPPQEHSGRAMELETALKELLRSRLEGLGPVTAERLAGSLAVPISAATAALVALEAEGFAFRGCFTPDATEEEWCERRLLARIHRYTLGRLRREIEPVTLTDFMRFLFDWQHIAEDARMIGPESVSAVVDQLQGFEAPAAAWEAEILAARVSDYDSGWLDALCLSGRFTWLRLSPGSPGRNGGRTSPPVRSTPVTLLRRGDLPDWLGLVENAEQRLSGMATRVLQCLDREGACFFDDLAAGAGLLRSQLEDTLGELCAAGLVNSDSFAGLRAMLLPAHKRGGSRGRRRGSRNPMSEAGRWSRVPARDFRLSELPHKYSVGLEAIEILAWALLNRYGVLMKPMLSREALSVPWRDLLRVCRRLEARGEIRGGRFVEGPAGEQFALPEAVSAMRAMRRKSKNGEMVAISAADPLNLVGILLPGERVPSLTGNRILFRDGVPVAVYAGKEVRFLLSDNEAESEWSVRNALLRRRMPTRLRADAKPIQ
jgi:ATP-dependent Lhr-like helicase